jgi:putative FmdB family regulatory protein
LREESIVIGHGSNLVQNRAMPLFEYACRDCGRRFEYLTRAGHSPSCPSCHSVELEKQLSVFAVSAGTSKQESFDATAPCGACGDPRGPGACSIN